MTKKYLSLLLALTVAVLAAGCGGKTAEPETAPESAGAEAQTQTQTAASRVSITEQATGVAPDEVIATVDGNSAPAELLTNQIGYTGNYLNYMLQAYGQDALDLHGTLPDGQSTAEYVMQESLTMLKQELVLENIAGQYGLTLSEEDEKELDEQWEGYLAEYGEEGFRDELYKMGQSEESHRRVTRASYLYQAFADACADPASPLYVPDDDLTAYAAEQGYITADHILIPTIDLDTREPLSDEEIAENRALAEDLLWQLRDSADPVALFKALADEHSRDTGRAANPDGYTFAEGTMVDEFDAAARALGENEYSDIVESAYGYHIILRKPLDAAAAADAVREGYYDRVFLDEVDAAEMELSPAVGRFDAAAVFDALRAAQGTDVTESPQENPFAP